MAGIESSRNSSNVSTCSRLFVLTHPISHGRWHSLMMHSRLANVPLKPSLSTCTMLITTPTLLLQNTTRCWKAILGILHQQKQEPNDARSKSGYLSNDSPQSRIFASACFIQKIHLELHPAPETPPAATARAGPFFPTHLHTLSESLRLAPSIFLCRLFWQWSSQYYLFPAPSF